MTGHDPGYVRDAVDLDNALQRLSTLAKKNIPIDIEQINEIHSLILGSRPTAGLFRREYVQIKGSKHTPPKTWGEAMSGMETWENGHLTMQTCLQSFERLSFMLGLIIFIRFLMVTAVLRGP